MKFILLLLIGLYSQFSFAQWQKLNSGTKEELNAIFFVNKDIGYTCGTNGYVAKTTNGGASWKNISIPKPFKLNDLYFIDSLIGYVVGINALIYKTIDGGDTWTEDKPISGETEFKSVCFKDTGYGIAVGEEGKLSIYDNGAWYRQSLTNRIHLNDVQINKDGYAVIAADSGKIYTKKRNDTFFDQYKSYTSSTPFTTVQFWEKSIFLTGGWYNDSLGKFMWHFLESTDTGKSFKAQNTGDLEVMRRTHFVSKTKAYYLGTATGFYASEDNLISKYRILPGTNNTLNNFHFVDSNVVYACGVAGTIVKTIHSPGWNTDLRKEMKQELSIYPNPVSEYLHIKSTRPIKEIYLYSTTGKIVFSWANKGQTLNLSELENGFYFLEITTLDGAKSRQKIVKE